MKANPDTSQFWERAINFIAVNRDVRRLKPLIGTVCVCMCVYVYVCVCVCVCE